jgi:hypothetical protein
LTVNRVTSRKAKGFNGAMPPLVMTPGFANLLVGIRKAFLVPFKAKTFDLSKL